MQIKTFAQKQHMKDILSMVSKYKNNLPTLHAILGCEIEN